MNLIQVVKSTMWKLSIKYFDHFFFSTECFWLKILIPANGVLSNPAKDEKNPGNPGNRTLFSTGGVFFWCPVFGMAYRDLFMVLVLREEQITIA